MEMVPDYLREQGVTEADISWWNGLGEEGQKEIRDSTYAANLTIAQGLMERGIGPEEGMPVLFKTALQYDDYPLDESFLKEWHGFVLGENDYPLPWQLRDRCDRFIWHCFNNGEHDAFKRRAEGYRTMNAFFRDLVRAGAI